MWGKYSNQLQDLFTPSGGSELKLSLTLEVSQISKKEKKIVRILSYICANIFKDINKKVQKSYSCSNLYSLLNTESFSSPQPTAPHLSKFCSIKKNWVTKKEPSENCQRHLCGLVIRSHRGNLICLVGGFL